MKFDVIREKLLGSDTTVYKPSEYDSPLAKELRIALDDTGIGVFSDATKLVALIDSFDIPSETKAQLRLIFTASNLSQFILNAQPSFSFVDMDNAVRQVVDSTGLSYQTVIDLVPDILFGCGIDFPIVTRPQIRKSGESDTKITALFASGAAQSQLDSINQLLSINRLLSADRDEADAKLASMLQDLVSAGNPQAYGMMGKLYREGAHGFAQDDALADKYLTIAAEYGDPASANTLAESNYNHGKYTLAHYYYTRPGAAAKNEGQQSQYADILSQREENRATFFFSIGVFVLALLFVVFFHQGIFSGSGRLIEGIIGLVLSGIVLYFAFRSSRGGNFESNRGLIFAQYLVWAIYALILILA